METGLGSLRQPHNPAGLGWGRQPALLTGAGRCWGHWSLPACWEPGWQDNPRTVDVSREVGWVNALNCAWSNTGLWQGQRGKTWGRGLITPHHKMHDPTGSNWCSNWWRQGKYAGIPHIHWTVDERMSLRPLRPCHLLSSQRHLQNHF